MQTGEFHLLNVFTGPGARGNPCAVVGVDSLSDERGLRIVAADLGLPATAFVRMRADGDVDVRWFSPEDEIRFCGHASIGAARVLLGANGGRIRLHASERTVEAVADGDCISLAGERIPCRETAVPAHVQRGFHGRALGYWATGDKDIVLLPDETSVREMTPDWQALRESDTFGYSITAAGSDCDLVSRVLRPHMRDPEDAATGSAHFALAPFWAARLDKADLHARQLSERGGDLRCRVGNGTVTLIARCERFAHGRLADPGEVVPS